MLVRPSFDPARDDAFHPPVAGTVDLERYSEWHHFNFNDDAADVYGLFNLALSGDVHHPSRARAGVSLVVCERGVGWHGTMNLHPLEDCTFASGSANVSIGGSAVRLRRGAYEVSGTLKDGSVALHARWVPRASAMRLDHIGGVVSSYLQPSFGVEGTLVLQGREIPLRGASGYHDHNWGSWDWGRDIGWDWGYILEPAGAARGKRAAAPLSIVFGRVTDGSRAAARSDLVVMVWEGERWSRAFVGDAVAIAVHGERRYHDVPRIPGVMSLLAPERPSIPEVVEIRAADGEDVLEISLRVDAALQFLIPHPATDGRTTISELVGEYTVRGTLDGRAVRFSYVGFAELAG